MSWVVRLHCARQSRPVGGARRACHTPRVLTEVSPRLADTARRVAVLAAARLSNATTRPVSQCRAGHRARVTCRTASHPSRVGASLVFVIAARDVVGLDDSSDYGKARR